MAEIMVYERWKTEVPKTRMSTEVGVVRSPIVRSVLGAVLQRPIEEARFREDPRMGTMFLSSKIEFVLGGVRR